MADLLEVPLSEAALSLGQSWAQAWRLALTGKLDARKVAGRWYVTNVSIAEVRELQGKGSCEAEKVERAASTGGKRP